MQYKLRKLTLEQFAVLARQAPFWGTTIELDTEVLFRFDKETRVLTNTVSVTVKSEQDVLLKAEMICDIEITPESVEAIRNKDGQFEFTPKVLVLFAGITFGALRGAVAVKSTDTPMANFVLPSVNLQSIINSAYVAV